MSTRTPLQILAGLARYLLTAHEGKSAIYRYARTVMRNQECPREEVLARQNAALVRIVNHAYQNCPYYREKFDAVGFRPGDIRTRDDLTALPTITRQELIDHVDQIVTRPRYELEHARTGGTTGTPLHFYRNRACSNFRRGIDLALPRYYGWRDGEWRGWLWAASADLVHPKSRKDKLIRLFADRQFFLDIRHIERNSVADFVRKINRYHPTFVSAYPSLAYTVAEYIGHGLVEPARVPVVSLTAEPAYEFQIARIKECLADDVFQRYGSREIGTAAFECPAHNGLHIFTESVHLETNDPLTAPGRRLLATDLLNTAMPLIRYETGDCAEIDNEPCSCGLATPRLKKILGREIDAIIRPDGSALAGLVIAPLIRRAGLRFPVQVLQHSPQEVEILVAGDTDECTAELEVFLALLRAEIGDDVTFSVRQVENIHRSASGKYRYVVSEVARRGSAASRSSG